MGEVLFFDHSIETLLAVLLHGTDFFCGFKKILIYWFLLLVVVLFWRGAQWRIILSFLPLGVNCLILGALHFVSTDLWLDYIRFELDHPDNKASTTGELYWRATKCLEGQYTEKFVGLHALLQARRV